MISPTQIKVIAAVAGVLLLLGVGVWTGRKLERTAWLEREVDLNAEAAEMIRVAAEDAAAAEREQAGEVLAVLTNYYKGLEADRDAKDEFVAGVVSGRIKLSVPTRQPCGGRAPGEGAAGAAGAQAETRAELSDEAGKFLISLATEADANTRQLNAVIEVLEACEAIATR